MLSTGVSCLFIPLFGSVRHEAVHLLLVIATLWLVWNAIHFFMSPSKEGSFRFAFLRLNIYVLLVITLLSLDRVFYFSYGREDLISQVLSLMGFKSV